MEWHQKELSKRAARTVLTGMCYSVGSATRQGSSS
ncbi:sugar phosphate isomerase/epimerase, partial [Shigella boydii]